MRVSIRSLSCFTNCPPTVFFFPFCLELLSSFLFSEESGGDHALASMEHRQETRLGKAETGPKDNFS